MVRKTSSSTPPSAADEGIRAQYHREQARRVAQGGSNFCLMWETFGYAPLVAGGIERVLDRERVTPLAAPEPDKPAANPSR
jgi:hypothetical protein